MALSESMKNSLRQKIATLKKSIIDIRTRAEKDIATKEKQILDIENRLRLDR